MNQHSKPVSVYERFQNADGSMEYKWLWMYWVRGERQFALTEEAAARASR